MQKRAQGTCMPGAGRHGRVCLGGNGGVRLAVLTHVCPVSPQCPRKCVRLPETCCSWVCVHVGACRRARGARMCVRWTHSGGTAVGEGLLMPVRTAALGGLGQEWPEAPIGRLKAGKGGTRSSKADGALRLARAGDGHARQTRTGHWTRSRQNPPPSRQPPEQHHARWDEQFAPRRPAWSRGAKPALGALGLPSLPLAALSRE